MSLLCPAFSDAAHSWQIAASEGETAPAGLRISKNEQSMFITSASNPRLRLSFRQWILASHRRTILAFQELKHARHATLLYGSESMKPQPDVAFAAFVEIDRSDTHPDSRRLARISDRW
jgi:hypothetical protein